jgi:hypothetical protein
LRQGGGQGSAAAVLPRDPARRSGWRWADGLASGCTARGDSDGCARHNRALPPCPPPPPTPPGVWAAGSTGASSTGRTRRSRRRRRCSRAGGRTCRGRSRSWGGRWTCSTSGACGRCRRCRRKAPSSWSSSSRRAGTSPVRGPPAPAPALRLRRRAVRRRARHVPAPCVRTCTRSAPESPAAG